VPPLTNAFNGSGAILKLFSLVDVYLRVVFPKTCAKSPGVAAPKEVTDDKPALSCPKTPTDDVPPLPNANGFGRGGAIAGTGKLIDS
jgi:hypothetical protein